MCRNAIKALGGMGAVEHAARDSKALLKLHLRPKDPYAHPLIGKRVSHGAVLLKVKHVAFSTT